MPTNRRLLATSFLGFSLMLVMAQALAGQPPITSQAEFTRYLHDTPPGTSLFDRLSPGGRKRLLAELQQDFGERGLRSVPYGDAANELTHRQVDALYGLFGVEALTKGVGLTPAEQALRARERAEDAKARGCAIETCPESEIEQRYDELILQKEDTSLSDAERFARHNQQYDRLFASYQQSESLRLVSRPDLRLLKRAVETTVLLLPSTAHVAQLQMSLAEMRRRGMAEDKDYAYLYQALIGTRQFAEAKTLAQQHPGMNAGTFPTFSPSTILPRGWPTALTLDKHSQAMTREAFDPSTPLRIVVVADCHFSQDAAHAIEADAQLKPLFAQHAIWLASQEESFDSAIDWNRKFPDQPIHIAWQNSEWPMLDSWAMPTFYVFHDGKLTKKFSGWYDLKTLKQSLREANALR